MNRMYRAGNKWKYSKNTNFRQKKALKRKEKEKNKKQDTYILTCNRTLPNVKKVIANSWDLLQINKKFQDIFQQIPILAFRRNKSLHDLLGCKNIVNNRVQKNS